MGSTYAKRACKHCGETFQPRFPNQRICRPCWPKWRRKYKRDYERKMRREIKREFNFDAA